MRNKTTLLANLRLSVTWFPGSACGITFNPSKAVRAKAKQRRKTAYASKRRNTLN